MVRCDMFCTALVFSFRSFDLWAYVGTQICISTAGHINVSMYPMKFGLLVVCDFDSKAFVNSQHLVTSTKPQTDLAFSYDLV